MKTAFLTLLQTAFIFVATMGQTKTAATANDKWAAGIGTGFIHVSGDVPAIKTQLQQHLSLQRSFSNWFSLQLAYTHGNARGLHWLASHNFAKNNAWAQYAAPVHSGNGAIVYGYHTNGVFTPAASADYVYYNHKTAINHVAVTARFTLPIPLAEPQAGIYVLVGAGSLSYNTRVNAAGSNGTYAALFNKLATGSGNKKSIYSALKDGMDNSFETKAEDYSKQPHFTRQIGTGVSFKIKKRFEVALEQTFSFTKSDLLDGQRWQEQPYGDAILTRDWDYLVLSTLCVKYFF